MKNLNELQFLSMAKKMPTQEVVDHILKSSDAQLKEMESNYVITLSDGERKSEASVYRFHLDGVDMSEISSRLKEEVEAAREVMRQSELEWLFGDLDESELFSTI